jgi:hypothetical protein
MRLPHRWTRTHRAETPRERVLCDARRAVRGVRRSSIWLGERPFSDKNGYDQVGYSRTGFETMKVNDGQEPAQWDGWKR